MDCECAICKNNKPFYLPKEIVEAAINGNLVLFWGGGISTEGKTVLPDSFYTSIKDELGITDDSVSFSHLMQLYCDMPNGRMKLLKKISLNPKGRGALRKPSWMVFSDTVQGFSGI